MFWIPENKVLRTSCNFKNGLWNFVDFIAFSLLAISEIENKKRSLQYIRFLYNVVIFQEWFVRMKNCFFIVDLWPTICYHGHHKMVKGK
jgi:hypothetical protein